MSRPFRVLPGPSCAHQLISITRTVVIACRGHGDGGSSFAASS